MTIECPPEYWDPTRPNICTSDPDFEVRMARAYPQPSREELKRDKALRKEPELADGFIFYKPEYFP